MQDYQVAFTVKRTSREVFNAVNNVKDWWGPVEGPSQNMGDEFVYRHGEIHYSKHRIIEMMPGKKVVWLTVDSRLNFVKQNDEWDGTRIVFEISEKDGQTTLTFTQEGLTPVMECYGACSGAWGYYVGESLKKLIEEGKGGPDQ